MVAPWAWVGVRGVTQWCLTWELKRISLPPQNGHGFKYLFCIFILSYICKFQSLPLQVVNPVPIPAGLTLTRLVARR